MFSESHLIRPTTPIATRSDTVAGMSILLFKKDLSPRITRRIDMKRRLVNDTKMAWNLRTVIALGVGIYHRHRDDTLILD